MEGDLQSSPHFEIPVDVVGSGADDTKVLTDLSTFLVATIQEVKDRISTIEYIFCSKLFPRFQSRSRSLQKKLAAAEARKAAEEDWEKKESLLLHQIEELRLEKQRAEEEAQRLAASLEQEMADASRIHEAEKKLLQARLESADRSEMLVAELREQLKIRASDAAQGKELQEKLLRQIDLKDRELLEEKSKRRQFRKSWERLEERYRHLKSQYSFLLGKTGLTVESKDGLEREMDSPMSHLNKRRCSQDSASKDQGSTLIASKTNELKDKGGVQERMEDKTDGGSAQSSNSGSSSDPSSTSSSLHLQKCPTNVKPESMVGQKWPISPWVDTRTRQEPGGADPHDDFLDTPVEVVRENLNKVPDEEVHDFPVLVLKDMGFNNSYDETQEMNAGPILQKPQISILKPRNKGFKYVEPVRKKAERESLKGVECKQCKKFYDAVLPDGGGKDGNNNNGNCNDVRCEHHEGVSRHRYRYIPPMTPEGFWNIGFDSEM